MENLLEETIQDFYQNCDDAGQSEYAVPRILYSLLLAFRPKTVVEIGSNMGLCSMAMAAALKFNAEHTPSAFLSQWKKDWHPLKELKPVQGKLFCIDPVLQPHFERRLKKFPLQGYIEFIQKRSDEVDPKIFAPIDCLFIDGDHSYKAAQSDFTYYFSSVAKGGYIFIHDYFPNSPSKEMLWWGPNILTRELREAFQFTDCLLIDTHFQGLAIFRKKSEHIDYNFYDTNLLKIILQFYARKYKIKLQKVAKKLGFSSNSKL